LRILAFLAPCARPVSFFASIGLALGLISYFQKSMGYENKQRMKEKSIVLISEGSGAALNRSQFKQEVANDLLAGQISFTEALERFRDSNLTSEGGMDNLRQMVQGGSDEERLVNQVLMYVKTTVGTNPGRYENKRQEIENEASYHMCPVVH
jgi:hypothetical protein